MCVRVAWPKAKANEGERQWEWEYQKRLPQIPIDWEMHKQIKHGSHSINNSSVSEPFLTKFGSLAEWWPGVKSLCGLEIPELRKTSDPTQCVCAINIYEITCPHKSLNLLATPLLVLVIYGISMLINTSDMFDNI